MSEDEVLEVDKRLMFKLHLSKIIYRPELLERSTVEVLTFFNCEDVVAIIKSYLDHLFLLKVYCVTDDYRYLDIAKKNSEDFEGVVWILVTYIDLNLMTINYQYSLKIINYLLQ